MSEFLQDHILLEPRILYFGTPVALISTLNDDCTSNLAPMSSAWALGHSIVLGLGGLGKTLENIARSLECVINLPTDSMWTVVEKLAPLTGKNPVPPQKMSEFRFEKDKFGAAGLTPIPSLKVRPPRVKECPLQMEAKVAQIVGIGDEPGEAAAVEVRVVAVHAHPSLVFDRNHINPAAWRPLIYNFRHYFGLGNEMGKTFRAEV